MLRSGRLERLCAGGSFVESGVSLDDWGVVGHDLICVDILFGQRLDSEGIYCGFGKGKLHDSRHKRRRRGRGSVLFDNKGWRGMQEKKCWWNILKDCYPAAIAGHNPQTTSLVCRPAKDDDGTKRKRHEQGQSSGSPYEPRKGLARVRYALRDRQQQ